MSGRGRPPTEAGIAVRSRLAAGTPLTSIETTLLLGYADLGMQVSRWRRGGAPIKQREVSHATVFARVAATLGAPATASPLIKAEHPSFTEYYLPMAYVGLSLSIDDEKRIAARLVAEAGIPIPSFEQIAVVGRAEDVFTAACEVVRNAEYMVEDAERTAECHAPGFSRYPSSAAAREALPQLRADVATAQAAAAKARAAIDAAVQSLRQEQEAA